MLNFQGSPSPEYELFWNACPCNGKGPLYKGKSEKIIFVLDYIPKFKKRTKIMHVHNNYAFELQLT